MPTPHKHAELIKAWADGAEIECRSVSVNKWVTLDGPGGDTQPAWLDGCEYRIKPQPPKKVEMWQWVYKDRDSVIYMSSGFYKNEAEAESSTCSTILHRAEWTRIEIEET